LGEVATARPQRQNLARRTRFVDTASIWTPPAASLPCASSVDLADDCFHDGGSRRYEPVGDDATARHRSCPSAWQRGEHGRGAGAVRYRVPRGDVPRLRFRWGCPSAGV